MSIEMKKGTMLGSVNLKEEIQKMEYNSHQVAEYKKKHPSELIIETYEDLDCALKAALNTKPGLDTPFRMVCPRCGVMKIRVLYDVVEIFNKGECGCVQQS